VGALIRPCALALSCWRAVLGDHWPWRQPLDRGLDGMWGFLDSPNLVRLFSWKILESLSNVIAIPREMGNGEGWNHGVNRKKVNIWRSQSIPKDTHTLDP
jgi:hypothetical protein